jgi:hypothetical protein
VEGMDGFELPKYYKISSNLEDKNFENDLVIQKDIAFFF